MNVTREEFTAAVNAINENLHGLQIQFQRIAQIQAELDALTRIVTARAEERRREG